MKAVPGGRFLFSKFIGLHIPYTGTLGAQVAELNEGHAVLELNDRRRVRNHLSSIHAVALMNLAELCSGLALHSALNNEHRAILVHFEIDFLKKARGLLKAEARFDKSKLSIIKQEPLTEIVAVSVRDLSGEEVVRAQAHWKVDLVRPKSS